jgi:pSer/pThr/pTyr-binding forkhead associated (FHA) protein
MTDTDTLHLDEDRKINSAGILSKRGVLLILSENFLGKSFILAKIVSIVGREKTSDIIINDPLISKEHCKITLTDEGHYHIEDMDSTNSTYLNSKLLKKPAHISYGDRIIIGDTIMRFFHEEKFESKE